jgi:hypothetical protein
MWRHARVSMFHGGGPRMKHQIERPITDVVVTENLIGSLTQVASLFASSALSFPS